MKRRGCKSCTPELSCVLHTVLPPLVIDQGDDTPVAQRVDHDRRREENKAPTRVRKEAP